MQRLTEALRGATDDEEATREHVLEVIGKWTTGEVDLTHIRRYTTAKDRFTATRFLLPSDPRWAGLMACLDALIATEATGRDGFVYQTNHGMITDSEIRSSRSVIERRGGRLVIRPDVMPADPPAPGAGR